MWVYYRLYFYIDRNDGRGGRRSGNFFEDLVILGEGYIVYVLDIKEYNIFILVIFVKIGFLGVIEVIVFGDFNFYVDGFFLGNLVICYLVCCFYVRKIVYIFILREIFFVKVVVRMFCDVGMVFIRYYYFSVSKFRFILYK